VGRYLNLAKNNTDTHGHNGLLNTNYLKENHLPVETLKQTTSTKETNLTKEATVVDLPVAASTETRQPNIDQLSESMRRLELSNILVAVLNDGDMRIVQSDREAQRTLSGGFTVYTPRDMYMYVHLSARERRMLHDFKKRFGGTVEWSERQ
jgi:hypothetical protein